MNRLQEPLKLPKYPQLLEQINEMIIAIRLHESNPTEEIVKARKNHSKPTWGDVVLTLTSAYHAINEQREDPRKY